MEADYGPFKGPGLRDRLVASLYGAKRRVVNRIKSRNVAYRSALEAQLRQDFSGALLATDLELNVHKHLMPVDVFYTELMSRMQKSRLYSDVTNKIVNNWLSVEETLKKIANNVALLKWRPVRLEIDGKDAEKYLPDRLKQSAKEGKLTYCTYEPMSVSLNAHELEGLLASALINRSHVKRFILDDAEDTDWLGSFLCTGKTLRVKTSTGAHFAYMSEEGSKAISKGVIDFSKKPSLPVTLYNSLGTFFVDTAKVFGSLLSAPFITAYGLYYAGYSEYAQGTLGALYAHIPISHLSNLTGMDFFFIPAFAIVLGMYASSLKNGASKYLRKRKEYYLNKNALIANTENKLATPSPTSS